MKPCFRETSQSYSAKCFTWIVLFNTLNNPDRQVILSLFFRRDNWDSERLSNLLNCSTTWSHPPSFSHILSSWSDLSNCWLGLIFIPVLDVWSVYWKLASTSCQEVVSKSPQNPTMNRTHWYFQEMKVTAILFEAYPHQHQTLRNSRGSNWMKVTAASNQW